LSAAATLLLWNPFLASTVAAHITGAPTYWRVLWLLPMPILIGVIFVSPIEHIGSDRPRLSRASKAIAGSLAALIFGTAVLQDPRAFAPSPANHVAFGWPSWKVPRTEFDAASAIVAAATPADRVLAPERVAPWIPTIHHYPAPLVVRAAYLPVLYTKLGGDELDRRMQLMRLVSGRNRPPLAVALLRGAIEDDRLAVVCVSKSATRWPDVMAVLPDMGFQRIHANADYEVWENPK
jgi:hypothetical protein